MPDLSRRDLLHVSGLTAAGMLTAFPALAFNPAPLAVDRLPRRFIDTDVLVIGGGMAGVSAALAARSLGRRVALVDKGCVGRSGFSPWAFRMAQLRAPEGSRALLHARVRRDSDGLNDPRWLDQLLDHQARVVARIQACGWLAVAPTQRAAIWQRQLADAGVTTIERVMVTSLIDRADGSVGGAVGFSYDDSRARAKAAIISSKTVVNCMGAGGLRAPGGLGWGQTHDGDALSYRAGATIAGKEFSDLDHGYGVPSALTDPRVRTAPALTIEAVTPSAEPGVRRARTALRLMQGEIAAYRGDPHPGFGAPVRVPGLGVFGGEGAVASGGEGQVLGVPGLYAAGGSLASMITGPCDPYPGLALLAAVVQGDVVGTHAAIAAASVSGGTPDRARGESLVAAMWGPRDRREGYDPAWVGQAMHHHLTPFFVSYWKQDDRLRGALDQVAYLRDHCLPRLIAGDGHALRLAHELDNQLLNQEMRLRASLFRTESRGTHFREDYPLRNDRDWSCQTLISRGADGAMQLARGPVPT